VGKTRRVTANLPTGLLEEACRTTGKGITETIVRGLDLVLRSGLAARFAELKGKLDLDIDIDEARERPPGSRGRMRNGGARR
jgi:hypothetical protein